MTDISVLTGCGWLLSEAPRSGHRATMAASSRGGQAPRPRRWEHSAGVQVGDGVVVVAVTGRIDQLAVAAFRQELLDTWRVASGPCLSTFRPALTSAPTQSRHCGRFAADRHATSANCRSAPIIPTSGRSSTPPTSPGQPTQANSAKLRARPETETLLS
jgi:hypothetical protein